LEGISQLEKISASFDFISSHYKVENIQKELQVLLKFSALIEVVC